MKKIIKTFVAGAIGIIMVSCASQNTQASNQRPSGQQGGPPSASQMIAQMDTNKDGVLAKSEVKGPLANSFSTIDANDDGYLSESELENAPRPQRGGGR